MQCLLLSLHPSIPQKVCNGRHGRSHSSGNLPGLLLQDGGATDGAAYDGVIAWHARPDGSYAVLHNSLAKSSRDKHI